MLKSNYQAAQHRCFQRALFGESKRRSVRAFRAHPTGIT